jgi:hypothetical protein
MGSGPGERPDLLFRREITEQWACQSERHNGWTAATVYFHGPCVRKNRGQSIWEVQFGVRVTGSVCNSGRLHGYRQLGGWAITPIVPRGARIEERDCWAAGRSRSRWLATGLDAHVRNALVVVRTLMPRTSRRFDDPFGDLVPPPLRSCWATPKGFRPIQSSSPAEKNSPFCLLWP